jgi:hypothetical protein
MHQARVEGELNEYRAVRFLVDSRRAKGTLRMFDVLRVDGLWSQC